MSEASKNERWPISNHHIRLLTVEDLAGLLQVSVRSVWRQVSLGQLPKPIYIGRLARWRQMAIENWLEDTSE